METTYRNGCEVKFPEFLVGKKSKDLMIKGGDFYAIFDPETGLWTTNKDIVAERIDKEFRQYLNPNCRVKFMSDYSSHLFDTFSKYCKNINENYHQLDRKIMFQNSEITQKDYASFRLPYSIEDHDTPAYDELMSTLYDQSERDKIEWAIGAVISGDSKKIQKFLVFVGPPGSGKSTVLNILQGMFKGYTGIFDSKQLANSNAQFSLSCFATNPLVAIQHDGDLSIIEDNTKINSIVSHEEMNVNEKFKSAYKMRFDSFLFMGTNRPVKISEAKSGIIRRLIDVHPSNRTLPVDRYNKIIEMLPFEYGGIAYRCLKKYEEMGKNHYNLYRPTKMMDETNDLFDFIKENYLNYKEDNLVGVQKAWTDYKIWCDDSLVKYPLTKRVFISEMKEYFDKYFEETTINDIKYKKIFYGFRAYKFNGADGFETIDLTPAGVAEEKDPTVPEWLTLSKQESILDTSLAECVAQYANSEDKPKKKWAEVTTKLKDISTNRVHYIMPPINHIVIDFDCRDKDGNKNLHECLKAAAKFPPTYAEVSKGGQGLHLHYIYAGDVDKLSRIFDDYIEIKVFTGNSSLRRKLSKCNNNTIATLSGGLPLKEEGKKMINKDIILGEKGLRTVIKKNLNKEIHGYTKPSIDMIKTILDNSYNAGEHYDVSDMRAAVRTFAISSTNNAEYCLKMVQQMKWKSEEPADPVDAESEKIVFFDVEVFPNLFVICWKFQNVEKTNVMINPSASEVSRLFIYRLIGFNNRDYDNHIVYAASLGYSNTQLYKLSQAIISNDRNAKFREAYNLSYTDIYDFCSKKQSLKKWEIELGIHHLELGLPWDQPVPEELWKKVAEYCINDVVSTEATFNANIADFESRLMLVTLANIFCKNTKSCPNDTSNTLTGRIIFGDNKKPQGEFVYTDLSKEFPGYVFKDGKSYYKGFEVGEGGFVWADPGVYYSAETQDIAGMHPSSAFALNIFGDRYTAQYKLIYDLRIFIKHKDIDGAQKMIHDVLDATNKPAADALAKLVDEFRDKAKAKAASKALKIPINSVYGMTSAHFDNIFRDPRNIDNIVAKRGALFMINLKEELEKRGKHVIHIKTDSVKVEFMDDETRQFIFEYGQKYGYTFETEHVFDRIALVNNAVYIAHLDKNDPEYSDYERTNGWTATGAQFAVPYVFKTLFSHEEIKFEDFCETKSCQSAIYLDFNENLPDVSIFEKEVEQRRKRKQWNQTISKNPPKLNPELESYSDDMLSAEIEKGHKYRFIGKVGSFTPVVAGANGGNLYRYADNKYSAVGGTKGYRWMESEMVKTLHLEDKIDKTYYTAFVDDAVETINKFGDFDMFINGLPF